MFWFKLKLGCFEIRIFALFSVVLKQMLQLKCKELGSNSDSAIYQLLILDVSVLQKVTLVLLK